jgi:hypothetical protein
LAFEVLAERHNFQKDVPSIDAGAGMIERLIAEPAHYGVAAEADGKLILSIFGHGSPVEGRSPLIPRHRMPA